MKILFCTLHVRRSLQAVPLAAGCLAAALPKDLRNNSELLDVFPDQSDEQILSAILKNAPDLIAFSVCVWNRQRLVNIARRLHQTHPQISLVAGGPEATGDTAGLAAEAPWTALVHGEGEA